MFLYYIKLASISIRKHWGLSLLMITAIGLGIGASMTTITVNYMMSANPIAHKNDVLYHVQLDSWDPNDGYGDNGELPDQLTYVDSTNLMKADRAFRQNVQSQMSVVIEPEGKDTLPFMVQGRANSADFFAMFDVPFLYGNGWSSDADTNKEQVVVLSRETNERLFGGEDSVGKQIRIQGNMFTVVGVINTWSPKPRFYDLTTGAFNESADVFAPFSLIHEDKLGRSGNTNCWKPVGEGREAFYNSECVWTQFWVELRDQQEKEDYMSFLNAYVEEQNSMGRFPRPLENRLLTPSQWLEDQNVVSDDSTMMMAMSLMFLFVCLLNTVGLLLAKFLGKSAEIGVRQALGASKQSLFSQYIVEASCIGFAGGILGLFLAWLGLKGIVILYGDMMQDLAKLDTNMVIAAVGMAVLTSIIAGVYPTWRASSIQPASQLKSQ